MVRLRRFSSGTLAVTTAGALLGTVFGLGATGQAPEFLDGSAWLWSRPVGEIARVNGHSGVVDLHYQMAASRGNQVQVAQDGERLVLHDQETGRITSVDLARLGFAGSLVVQPGGDVTVALSGPDCVVIDRARGLVRAVDPVTMQPTGEPLQLPPGLVGGEFDESGVLWLGVPSQGTVVALRVAGGQVVVAETVAVAAPGTDLAVSVLDGGALVVDRDSDALVAVIGDEPHRMASPVDLSGAEAPARTTGDLAVVTVPGQQAVVVVGDPAGGDVRTVSLPGGGRQAVPFAGRIYLPDDDAGVVRVFDPDGAELEPVELPGATGPLELVVRQGLLFVNAVDAPVAAVITPSGEVSLVDKFDPEAALPAPDEEPAPEPAPEPQPAPQPGPPGVPAPVTVLAGDGQVQVSWARAATTGGAAVDRYLVTWPGDSAEVDGDTLSIVATGLVNGQEYQFRVIAENEFGQSPPALSEPVTPVAAVAPPTPAAPTATVDRERVTVTWPAVAEAGDYLVTPFRDGEPGANPPQTVSGESTEFEGLALGAGYTFTVVARSGGAASDPSPPSNQVVPFSVPDAPGNLAAEPEGNGQVYVWWSEPAGNGRPVESYRVRDAGSGELLAEVPELMARVPEAGLTEVAVTAVNEAGEGPAATTTVAQPPAGAVTITDLRPMDGRIRISFTLDGGFGPDPQCTVEAGGSTVAADCAGDLIELTGLNPATGYTAVVTATAGGATVTDTQDFTTYPTGRRGFCISGSYCEDNGLPIYFTASADLADAAYHHRDTIWAICRFTGPTFDATSLGGRSSDVWIMKSNSTDLVPYALVDLPDLDTLPTCTHR